MDQNIVLNRSQIFEASKININDRIVLGIGFLFTSLILIDAPLIIFYSLSHSIYLTKVLLYGSEAAIILIFGYLLLYSMIIKLPRIIYLFIIYISLMGLVGVLFSDSYQAMKDARRYIATIPPLFLGYYFAYYFGDKKEKYLNIIIVFLTIMSIISLLEWFFFLSFYNQILAVYSKVFQTGSYFASIKYTSHETETGLVNSGLAQMVFRQFGFVKRATGLYLEPYSAGINSAMAIILILYAKISGIKLRKTVSIFVVINVLAVILSTSRSAYLFLYIPMIVYFVIQRKVFLGVLFCMLPFFSGPFREIINHSIETLGGSAHKDAIVMLPKYLYDNYLSIQGLFGTGLGTFMDYSDAGAIKEIFIQLGLLGLLAFFFFHYAIMSNISRSKANTFIVVSMSIMIFMLCIYSGRIFGYKSLGLVYFFLGYISVEQISGKQIFLRGNQ